MIYTNISHGCRIGDWYPERNIFQILIALTSGKHDPEALYHVMESVNPAHYMPPNCIGSLAILPYPIADLIAAYPCFRFWDGANSGLRRLGIYHI
jgi:hypothetical protein